MILLLGLSWTMSLVEGLACDSSEPQGLMHVQGESSHPSDSDEHHAESCHFGHCTHIHARFASSIMVEPDSHAGLHVTPYSFFLPRAPLFFLMRPPLAIV